MIGMKDVVTAIHAAGLADVKVIVGGAPVTADFADQIGADGYAQDAATAVSVARSIVGSASRVQPVRDREAAQRM